MDNKEAYYLGNFISVLTGTLLVDPFQFINENVEHLNKKNENNYTILIKAIERNLPEIVNNLISKHVDLEIKCGPNNKTALHFACSCRNVTIMKMLLNAGANIEATDTCNWTLLHYSARYNHKESIELLISLRANKEAKDKNNKIPFDLIPGHNKLEYLELFGMTKIECTSCNEITYKKCIDKIRYLSVICPNCITKTSNPLESMALKENTGETIKLLEMNIEYATIKNNHGSTLLMFASGQGNNKLIQYLLTRYNNINEVNKIGYSALHYAATLNQFETAKLLIEYGANKEIKSWYNHAPFDLVPDNEKEKWAELFGIKNNSKSKEFLNDVMLKFTNEEKSALSKDMEKMIDSILLTPEEKLTKIIKSGNILDFIIFHKEFEKKFE